MENGKYQHGQPGVILSVITLDASLKKVLESDLIGIESEIIINNWQDGLAESTGQFICFLEAESDYRSGLFIRGLLNMLIKPSFRKLSMVSAAVEELARDRTIWGYKCDDTPHAVIKLSGGCSHPVQVGYIPGSIIRRSALDGILLDLNGPVLQNSIDFSIALWSKGLRVHLDPQMVYQVDQTDIKLSHELKISSDVRMIWHRESI